MYFGSCPRNSIFWKYWRNFVKQYFFKIAKNILWRTFFSKLWRKNISSQFCEEKKSSHTVKKNIILILICCETLFFFSKKNCEGKKKSTVWRFQKVSQFWEPPPLPLRTPPPSQKSNEAIEKQNLKFPNFDS